MALVNRNAEKSKDGRYPTQEEYDGHPQRKYPQGPAFPRQWNSSGALQNPNPTDVGVALMIDQLDDKHFDTKEDNELKEISAGIRQCLPSDTLEPPPPLQPRNENHVVHQPFKPVVVNPVGNRKETTTRNNRENNNKTTATTAVRVTTTMTEVKSTPVPTPTSGIGRGMGMHNPYSNTPITPPDGERSDFVVLLHSGHRNTSPYSEGMPNVLRGSGETTQPAPPPEITGRPPRWSWWNAETTSHNPPAGYHAPAPNPSVGYSRPNPNPMNGNVGIPTRRPVTTLRSSTPPDLQRNAWLAVQREEMHLHYDNVPYQPDPSACEEGMTEDGLVRRLEQRRKQISYGKGTEGYRNYLLFLPDKSKREFHNDIHPVTPRPEYHCSKRAFDKHLNTWRRKLHLWDDFDPENILPRYLPQGAPTLGDLGLARQYVSPPSPSHLDPVGERQRETPTGLPPKMQSIASAMSGAPRAVGDQENSTPLNNTQRQSPSVVFDNYSSFASGSALRHSSLRTPSRPGPDGPEVGSNFFNSLSTINSPYLQPSNSNPFYASGSTSAYLNSTGGSQPATGGGAFHNYTNNNNNLPPPGCGLTPHSKTPRTGSTPNYHAMFRSPTLNSPVPFHRFTHPSPSPFSSEEFPGNGNYGTHSPYSHRPPTVPSIAQCKTPS